MKKELKMQELCDYILKNEEWLMGRILDYAKKQDYTRYTSTLLEAWRVSISGLSSSLSMALKKYKEIPELEPDDDYKKDPIASFGVIEAQKHRSRGVTLGMFLGLMKYYRQAYMDLILQSEFKKKDKDYYRLFIERFFDRVELGFCTEWSSLKENEKLEELQTLNRFMTNEKNKYLTAFESLNSPAVLFDTSGKVININHAGLKIFLKSDSFRCFILWKWKISRKFSLD